MASLPGCSLFFDESSSGAPDAGLVVADDASADAGPADAAVGICISPLACPVGYLTGPCGCYLFLQKARGSWHDGAITCAQADLGPLPVVVESAIENAWIAQTFTERLWLGLGASIGAETWGWINMEELGEYHGFPGPPPEPSTSQSLCASTENGIWQSSPCEDDLPQLCELYRASE